MSTYTGDFLFMHGSYGHDSHTSGCSFILEPRNIIELIMKKTWPANFTFNTIVYFQVISHVMKFLTVADRKDASLVSKKWYEASLDPALWRNISVRIPAQKASLRKLGRIGQIQEIVVDSANDFITSNCRNPHVPFSNVHTLSVQDTDITEGQFMKLLSQFRNLESLALSSCNTLFMAGTLFSSKQKTELAAAALGTLRALDLSSIRYLSDELLQRFIRICPVLEHISLAKAPLTFHSTDIHSLHCGISQAATTSLLTFRAILQFISDRTSVLKSLDLSRTEINTDCLRRAISIPNLHLREIHLSYCPNVGDDAVSAIYKYQPGLEVLALTHCLEISDKSLSVIGTNLSCLRTLLVNECSLVSDSVSRLHNAKDLTVLNLASCPQVTSRALSEGLQNLALVSLNLNCCSSIDDMFLLLTCTCLSHLRHLDLGGTNISNKGLVVISMYSVNLHSLRLAWCKGITDDGLLGNVGEDVHHLEEVLEKDQHTIIFNKPAKYRSKATSLQDLEKRVHQLTKGEVYPIYRLSHLRQLDLTACKRVTDRSISKVIQFNQLQSLKLNMCGNVTDSSLSSLAKNATALEDIGLSGCDITDLGLVIVLTKLHRLTSLDISNCDRITNQSMAVLSRRCRNIKSLNVSLCSRISPNAVDILEQTLPCLKNVQRRLIGSKVQQSVSQNKVSQTVF